jgi:outer membrane protein OmpA-like peptidoglycan-associated protein
VLSGASPQTVHRQTEERDEKKIQPKTESGASHDVSPGIESALHTLKGGGHPLPESVRAFFEPRFGYSFADVRIHTDSEAIESAQAVNARASTIGHNVVFGTGQYAPHSEAGKNLLSHELMHVVQQTASGYSALQRQDEEPPAEPPYVGLSPTKTRVGTHQKFPVHYQVLNFHEPSAASALELYNDAPVTITQGIPQPTEPYQTGDMLLEANGTEGVGNLSIGFTYEEKSYSSSPITIEVTPGPTQISSPDRIYFDTDQAAIRSDAAAGLDQVAARLAQEPSLVVTCLEGHADTRYTDDYNLALSERRAEAAYSYLMTKGDAGFHPDQVKDALVIGFGEAAPVVAPETNEAEFQLNRRVEIYLSQSPIGEEPAPSIQLSPAVIQVGIGQKFSLLYDMTNVHNPSKFGGSTLVTTMVSGSPTLAGVDLEGTLPKLPGGEVGILTLFSDQPGFATVAVRILYGVEYLSNEVKVEITGPSMRIVRSWEPAYETLLGNRYIGDQLTLHYMIENMPDPSLYGGSELEVCPSNLLVLLGGLPIAFPGERLEGDLVMQANDRGEVLYRLSTTYNGEVYGGDVFIDKIEQGYTDFVLSLIAGGEGGELVGAGVFTFSLQEIGFGGGREKVILFVGAGPTLGAPAGGYGPSSPSYFSTPLKYRIEDFGGAGAMFAAGVFGINPVSTVYLL